MQTSQETRIILLSRTLWTNSKNLEFCLPYDLFIE